MKFIKRIEEGESWTAAVIGWKKIEYRGLNDERVWAFRLGLYLGFVLIKVEFIQV